MVPIVQEPEAEVRIISGSYKGTSGPVFGDYVKTRYLDVGLQPEAEWELDTDPEHTLFCYVIEGSLRFPDQPEPVPSHRAVLTTKGDLLKIQAQDQTTRFLLIAGSPLKEPIAWGGPIVMNTRDELAQAFRDPR